LWAVGVFLSRAFTSDPAVGSDVVIIPVEDMFAHLDPVAVESHVRVRIGSNGVEFVSNTDIPKGSLIERMVKASRGMSNAQLLFQYGFVFDYNPQDFVIVNSPFHPQLPKSSIMKQILQKARCDTEEFQVFQHASIDDILCVARVVSMSEDDLVDPEKVASASGRRAVSEAVERRALSATKGLAAKHLSFFSTTLELDNSILEADKKGIKPLTPNERRAITIRRTEKAIWSDILRQASLLEANIKPDIPSTRSSQLKDEL